MSKPRGYPTDEELQELRDACCAVREPDIWFDHVADKICALWDGEADYRRGNGVLYLPIKRRLGNTKILGAVDGTAWDDMFIQAIIASGSVWYADLHIPRIKMRARWLEEEITRTLFTPTRGEIEASYTEDLDTYREEDV